jgi:transcriptional regulator with XRE-family HTH domain
MQITFAGPKGGWVSAIAALPEDPIQDWQQKTYERLHNIVPPELVEDGADEETQEEWVAHRKRLIDEIIDCILDIANGMPDGVEDPGVARMLARAIELQRAAQDDPEGLDPKWEVRKAAISLKDTVHLMERRLDRLRLDDPGEAASFVIKELQNVPTQRVAQLLGVSPKTVSQWRGGKVASIKKEPDRVVLIGQLIRYLRSTWTPHGILAWFETPRKALDDRSALQLIDSGDSEAWEPLRELARGSRSQLAD